MAVWGLLFWVCADFNLVPAEMIERRLQITSWDNVANHLRSPHAFLGDQHLRAQEVRTTRRPNSYKSGLLYLSTRNCGLSFCFLAKTVTPQTEN